MNSTVEFYCQEINKRLQSLREAFNDLPIEGDPKIELTMLKERTRKLENRIEELKCNFNFWRALTILMIFLLVWLITFISLKSK